MDCPLQTGGNADILLDYCARKLGPDDAMVFERHIASCSECQKFSASQQMVWSALDAWEAAPVPENFDARLYDRISHFESSSWWRRLSSSKPQASGWKPVAPLAAACAAVVAAFLIYSPATAPVVPVQEGTRIESIEPEQVERTLEDLEMLKQLSLASGSQSL